MRDFVPVPKCILFPCEAGAGALLSYGHDRRPWAGMGVPQAAAHQLLPAAQLRSLYLGERFTKAKQKKVHDGYFTKAFGDRLP